MSVSHRLNQILVDRPLAPWAMRLGLGRPALEILRSDAVPPPRAIDRITAYEGVRRRWLVDGVGERFTVMRAGSDEATAVALNTMLDERPSWCAHRLDTGGSCAIVLTHPGRLEHPFCPYTIVAIVGGAIGERTLEGLHRRRTVSRRWLPSPTVAAVRAARVGPYELLGEGDREGLLGHPPARRASA
jgi:hypothetical protein